MKKVKEVSFVLRIDSKLNKYFTKRAKLMGLSKNQLLSMLLETYATCGIEFKEPMIIKYALTNPKIEHKFYNSTEK